MTADCLCREKKAAKIAYSKYIASQGIDGSANFTDYPQHDEAITAAYTDETSGKEPLVDVNASTHETLIEWDEKYIRENKILRNENIVYK